MATITISNGDVALVDDDLFGVLNQWKWQSNGRGYACRKERGRSISMHRLVIDCPPGLELDHINGDKLDNRRENLRVCTHAENVRNRGQQIRRDPGLPKGVTACGKRGRYAAHIKYDGRIHRIGTFDSPEEAAHAYDVAAIKHHGEFARPNFLLATVPAQATA